MESRADAEILGLGDLAREAGVPVGTVKYYLREGLLPAGRRRSATRADYGPQHLRRLRLLRLLREVGDIPIDRLRHLVATLDAPSEAGPIDILASGAEAVAGAAPEPGPLAGRAAELAGELADSVGWTALPRAAPEWDALRAVLETVLSWEPTGLPVRGSDLQAYADAADQVARHDIAALRETAEPGSDPDPAELLTQLVVGQVVYGRLLEALRRLGQAEHSVRRWAGGAEV